MIGGIFNHALNKRTAKPCRSLMPHSVAPINAAVCNKARSPLGDRQCAHELRTFGTLTNGIKVLIRNYAFRFIKNTAAPPPNNTAIPAISIIFKPDPFFADFSIVLSLVFSVSSVLLMSVADTDDE